MAAIYYQTGAACGSGSAGCWAPEIKQLACVFFFLGRGPLDTQATPATSEATVHPDPGHSPHLSGGRTGRTRSATPPSGPRPSRHAPAPPAERLAPASPSGAPPPEPMIFFSGTRSTRPPHFGRGAASMLPSGERPPSCALCSSGLARRKESPLLKSWAATGKQRYAGCPLAGGAKLNKIGFPNSQGPVVVVGC